VDQLWLDLRPIGDAATGRQFSPPCLGRCRSFGLEPTTTADPICTGGGITGGRPSARDLSAAPALPGALCVGEVACTGVQWCKIAWPAIRLMECLVFARQLGGLNLWQTLTANHCPSQPWGAGRNLNPAPMAPRPMAPWIGTHAANRRQIRRRCGALLAGGRGSNVVQRAAARPSRTCGSRSSNWSMSLCLRELEQLEPGQRPGLKPSQRRRLEARSRTCGRILTLAILLVEAAEFRQESPWRHFRTDAAAPSRFLAAPHGSSKKIAAIQTAALGQISSPKEGSAALKPLRLKPAEAGA